jgi:hypothetical protein
MKHSFWFSWSVCLALFACGSDAASDGGAADAAVIVTSGPILPFQQGNTWTYKVTGDGEVSEKVTTIGAAEPVGGTGPHASTMAFKVVTKKGTSDQTISWQGQEGDRVVRYREQAFHEGTGELEEEEHWDPAKLHIDGSAAHSAQGASWLESYQETKLPVGEAASTETARDRWSVDAIDQLITVPAGTFKAIVFIKAGGSTLKTYWYVPGVGKVKETGGQTEELVRYEVAP